MSASDVAAVALPFTHRLGACWNLLLPLTAGGAAVLPPGGGGPSPEALLRLAARHGVTVLHATPPMLAALAAEYKAAAAGGGGSGGEALKLRLRYAMSGAAPLASREQAAARAALGVPVVNAYGASEAGMVLCGPVDGRAPDGSAGVQLQHGMELALRRPGGGEAAPGEEGEVRSSEACHGSDRHARRSAMHHTARCASALLARPGQLRTPHCTPPAHPPLASHTHPDLQPLILLPSTQLWLRQPRIHLSAPQTATTAPKPPPAIPSCGCAGPASCPATWAAPRPARPRSRATGGSRPATWRGATAADTTG